MRSKKVKGYARYIFFEDGKVQNIATENYVVPDAHNYGRMRLINDDGKRTWFDPIEFNKLFPAEAATEPVKAKKVFILPDSMEERRKIQRPGKITAEQVAEIRKRAAAGELRPKQGPKEYGICPQTLGKIIDRKIYTELP